MPTVYNIGKNTIITKAKKGNKSENVELKPNCDLDLESAVIENLMKLYPKDIVKELPNTKSIVDKTNKVIAKKDSKIKDLEDEIALLNEELETVKKDSKSS